MAMRTAGLQKVQVALDEQNVSPDFALGSAVLQGDFDTGAAMRVSLMSPANGGLAMRMSKLNFRFCPLSARNLLLAVKPYPIGRYPSWDLFQSLSSQTLIVQCVEVENVGLPVPGDKVQGAGNPDRLFVKVHAKDPQNVHACPAPGSLRW